MPTSCTRMQQGVDMTEREALQLVLDHVDYMAYSCQCTDMVGAVLPVQVIKLARKALAENSDPMSKVLRHNTPFPRWALEDDK